MLNISNIQHFSVGDGQGIRTTVFFKGCNLRCPWCHNPETISPEKCLLKYQNKAKPEVCGRQTTADEILPELLEDKIFYETSGGGVTLSGGEVMLQAEAIVELCQKLKQNNVSVLIDTAGCVPYNYFEKINEFVTGYLFDFKTANSEKYKQIGGNLQLVSENIQKLIADNVVVRIRIPLIRDFNGDEKSIKDICEYLKNIGITEVDLLPFHRLGVAKYNAMGLDYAYKDQPPLSKAELKNIEQQYAKYFKVNIER